MNSQRVVERAAAQYISHEIPGEWIDSASESLDTLYDYLSELNSNYDKLLMLSIVEKAVIKKNEDHKEKCSKPECSAEHEAEDMLYGILGFRNEYDTNGELSSQEISSIIEYINELSDRIDQLARSNGISLDLISEIKNDWEDVKYEVESIKKSNARRQFNGAVIQTIKLMVKLGIKREEVIQLVNKGIENPHSILEGETILETTKLLL